MPEFRSIRVHAIVLRHADWGEADRLVTLFTREQGKLRAVAKGARKITSRKAGHLEPFTHVKLQLARGRSLFIVTQADTVDAYIPLRETLVMDKVLIFFSTCWKSEIVRCGSASRYICFFFSSGSW